MLAVLDESSLKNRLILKYSYHLEIRDRRESGGLKDVVARTAARLTSGFGLSGLTFSLASNQLQWAGSYHFECVAPAGLRIQSLKLPSELDAPGPSDLSGSVVGHASGQYNQDGAIEPIEIALELDGGGALPRVVLWSAALLVFYSSLICIFPVYVRLAEAPDLTTALLLSAPAFLLGLSARGSENLYVSQIMFSLRASVVALSLSLYVLAAGFALGFEYSFVEWWFAGAFIVTSFVFAASLVGWCLLKQQRTIS